MKRQEPDLPKGYWWATLIELTGAMTLRATEGEMGVTAKVMGKRRQEDERKGRKDATILGLSVNWRFEFWEAPVVSLYGEMWIPVPEEPFSLEDTGAEQRVRMLQHLIKVFRKENILSIVVDSLLDQPEIYRKSLLERIRESGDPSLITKLPDEFIAALYTPGGE